MRKLETINLVAIFTLAVSFFNIVKIDNESRLPANLYTDYHMQSLPFIYLVIASLNVLVIVSLVRINRMRKNNRL